MSTFSVQSRFVPAANHRAGFTLLEIIVAAGITAIVAGFMVAIVSNVSGFWGRSAGRLSAGAQARYVLDQLALDLQSARVAASPSGPHLTVDLLAATERPRTWRPAAAGLDRPSVPPATGLSIGAADIGRATFRPGGTLLRFSTHRRGANERLADVSAPVAVGWQIVRRAPSQHGSSADERYFLHRSEVRPAGDAAGATGTLELGYDLDAPGYTARPEDTIPVAGSPGSLREPSAATIVAENVVDFGVHIYGRVPTGELRRVFPIAGSTAYRDASDAPGSPAPVAVDVMVRILSDEGARLLGRLEADFTEAADASAWWALVLANSHVFTRRIGLIAESGMAP